MKTQPITYVPTLPLCKSVSIKLIGLNMQRVEHRTADCGGSEFLSVRAGTDPWVTVSYLSPTHYLLKAIRYNASQVVEIMQEESLCEYSPEGTSA